MCSKRDCWAVGAKEGQIRGPGQRGVGWRLGFLRTEPWGHLGLFGVCIAQGAAGEAERSIPGGCFGGESAPTSGVRNQERWYQPEGGAGLIKGAGLHTMRRLDSPYLSSPRCEGPWGRGAEGGGWWVLQGWVRELPPHLFAGETSPGKY